MIAVAKKHKRTERKARLVANGPTFDQVNIGGKWVLFENAAVPHGIPIYRALCEVCHHASAWLMLRVPPTVICMSCKEDQIATEALRVQEECGVDLGWKTPAIGAKGDYLSVNDARTMNMRRKR